MNFASLKNAFLKPLIPVIKINGVINVDQTSKVALSLKKVNPSRSKALAVVINSPGGSPVQSEIICHKIKHFCHEHKLPLYTFAEDVAASGGYFILCIGDKVFVDPSSLVGSIGVVSHTVKIKKTLEEHKINVKNLTTREELLSYKFSPLRDELTAEDKKVIEDLLKKTHNEFIHHVEEHRKNKLLQDKEKRKELIYNADVFLGRRSIELGLADNVGDYHSVLYNEFPQAKIVNITSKSVMQQYREALGLTISELKSRNSIVTMTPEEQRDAIISKYNEFFKK